jgi:hypothetical protein
MDPDPTKKSLGPGPNPVGSGPGLGMPAAPYRVLDRIVRPGLKLILNMRRSIIKEINTVKPPLVNTSYLNTFLGPLPFSKNNLYIVNIYATKYARVYETREETRVQHSF